MKAITVDLYNRQQAYAAIKAVVYPYLTLNLQDGNRLVMTVGPRKRTIPQNKRYWGKGVLAQIADQAVSGGKLHSAENWHEVFKQKFIGLIELPNGTVKGMSSADLDTSEFSLFCTAVEAYACTDLNVIFYELEPP